MTPSDSCYLAPYINTLTHLLTLPTTLVLDKILDTATTEYSSGKKFDLPSPSFNVVVRVEY